MDSCTQVIKQVRIRLEQAGALRNQFQRARGSCCDREKEQSGQDRSLRTYRTSFKCAFGVLKVWNRRVQHLKAQHPLDEVLSAHELRDAMLHLQPRVHLPAHSQDAKLQDTGRSRATREGYGRLTLYAKMCKHRVPVLGPCISEVGIHPI